MCVSMLDSHGRLYIQCDCLFPCWTPTELVYPIVLMLDPQTGASIPPETMMHFPPVSDFPPISEKFSDFLKFFYNFTFSRKISSLSSAKISDDLFGYRPQISNFPPIFAVSIHFPPLFRQNNSFPPYFYKFPPVLDKFTCFLHTLRVFFPPTLTSMHLCITQCTYWSPLSITLILGSLGIANPRIWAGGIVGVGGGSQGSRGRVVKYYYILLCTGSLFESDDF